MLIRNQYLNVLESFCTIDVNLTIEITSQNDWSSWAELDDRLRSMNTIIILVCIKECDDRAKSVDL